MRVSFDTDVAGVAVLWIGPSPGSMDSLALDARGNLHEDNDHLFYLDTYTWGKEFYFEIEFLGVVYDDHGAPFHIQP